MVELPKKTRHQLGVLVVRAERPAVGFGWQLREYGKAEPMMAGETLYASQDEARRAGDTALAKFRADESLSRSRGP